MARLRNFAANLATMVVSVAVFLALCELVVFRFVWLASDVPANAFVDDVVRYAPGQSGVWRVRDEIAAPYRINAQGWNSGAGDYAVARRPGVERIAIVGDSYVEALQVPFDQSFGEKLRDRLGATGRPAEIYRFGISGAPMSQYLKMVEHEVARYRPDWIVVLLVHNDFSESYRFQPGRYASSFLKLRIDGDRVTGEIPPEPWRAGGTEWLRQTATARFFLYRWRLRPEALAGLLLPAAHAEIAANIDIDAVLRERPAVEAVTDHVLRRLAAATAAMDARLLVAIDTDRTAVYRETDSPALGLNHIAAGAAARHRVPFVDLTAAFRAEWAAEHRYFEFAADGHWNERGHAVAAAAIAGALRQAASAP